MHPFNCRWGAGGRISRNLMPGSRTRSSRENSWPQSNRIVELTKATPLPAVPDSRPRFSAGTGGHRPDTFGSALFAKVVRDLLPELSSLIS